MYLIVSKSDKKHAAEQSLQLEEYPTKKCALCSGMITTHIGLSEALTLLLHLHDDIFSCATIV